MAKINIGKMACETCNNDVTVKQNENATLSYRCDECDAAPYAKTGTLQNEHWRNKLRPLASQMPIDQQAGVKKEVKGLDTPPPAAPPKEKTKTVGFFGEL